ncbi:hypothetical protein DID88_008334 [Monilinia fructigena]|uniref:Ubiquitin 3 binding protein But2 C-terminal domain-containing protein n=1 Tax=Monilinia fructigena TaxID=38457 RepID=A0A395JA39_9HELO|nr:hypothetical protein DID88_008334 [Monilinia fructigena]
MTPQVKVLVTLCILLLKALVDAQSYDFTVGPSADVPIAKLKTMFTTILSNDHNSGTWEVDMQHDNGALATDNKILPGDTIYSVFEYNSETLVTSDNVTIIPGPAKTTSLAAGKLNVARLRVWLGVDTPWDFGPIVWNNVTITSQTTDPWWCNDAWKASDNLNVTGRVTMFWGEGDKTICEYEYMSWEPTKKGN